MKAIDHFSSEERKNIRDAITRAEQLTSGEIRVYIEDECHGDVLDRAAFIFSELKMHQTELRNGVLIYLALHHRKFAILGDAGIHAKVGTDFWNSIKDTMLHHFKVQKFTKGLIDGIDLAGDALKEYFPHRADDKNELSDDIVFG